MYDNISEKIKGLAKAIAVLLIISSIVAGIALAANGYNFFLGILVIVVGSLLSWVSSWVLYGFGEIIETLHAIQRNTQPSEPSAPKQKKSTPTQTKEGVILEEESELPQVICPICHTKYDFDAPKCPNCKQKNCLIK